MPKLHLGQYRKRFKTGWVLCLHDRRVSRVFWRKRQATALCQQWNATDPASRTALAAWLQGEPL